VQTLTPPQPRSLPADRLRLQGRAPANLRRHLLRGLVRFALLAGADLVSFVLMRILVQAVRDQAAVGAWVAQRAHTVMARGVLNGWQFAAALFVALVVTGNYGTGDRRRDPRRLFFAAALATALPLWMTLWSPRGLDVVLAQYVLTAGLVWLGLVAERQAIDGVVRRLPESSRRPSRALFVGSAAACRVAQAGAAFGPAGDYRSIGFVDLERPAATDALGDLTELARVLDASRADTVVLCGELPTAVLDEVMAVTLAAGCQLLAQPPVLDVAGVQPALVWRQDQPLIALMIPGLKGWQLLVKRLVDVTGSAFGLALLAPVMLGVAALIKRGSPGPVFFRQERIGAGGRRFMVWKFRTMRHDTSDAAHRELIGRLLKDEDAAQVTAAGERVYKLVNDERVTPVGRWLRRTSLDELPQLLNVLRGEMSLVGPRPPVDYEFEAYDLWQFDRLQVKPGITGLWQVSGRSRLTYREMCELDLQYVRHWSLWLDLRILLRTIPVVLFNSGRAA
jgi:exopolysaccharide biosynthesis polyprenyl glycosylphosphotransferase